MHNSTASLKDSLKSLHASLSTAEQVDEEMNRHRRQLRRRVVHAYDRRAADNAVLEPYAHAGAVERVVPLDDRHRHLQIDWGRGRTGR